MTRIRYWDLPLCGEYLQLSLEWKMRSHLAWTKQWAGKLTIQVDPIPHINPWPLHFFGCDYDFWSTPHLNINHQTCGFGISKPLEFMPYITSVNNYEKMIKSPSKLILSIETAHEPWAMHFPIVEESITQSVFRNKGLWWRNWCLPKRMTASVIVVVVHNIKL